jgi:drug/metabolite transporter (DMT)-like permease
LLASAVLLVAAAAMRRRTITKISVKDVALMTVLGVSGYAIAQGLLFVGLAEITAISTTFVLNFTPILVVLLGWPTIRETPTIRQWVGMGVSLMGAYFFFGRLPTGTEASGVLVVLVSSLGWALYLVTVRKTSQRADISGLSMTSISMTIGALFMFGSALVLEGWKPPSLSLLWIIFWLALVNTAGAFLIWNTVLRYVKAFELSMIQNTMLIQIPILALLFLGESISPGMLVGMVAVFVGVVLVQLR